MPVGTYKKGHRHGADFHVMCATGVGYSLLWYDIAKDLVKVDWDNGGVFAPPDGMFHQHFNASTEPERDLRSEERGVGKECVRTGRSRWWSEHSKKQKIT